MKEKSVERNAVLNSAKTILKLILPLITFPYISRILQVENLGKINYVKSIRNFRSADIWNKRRGFCP